MMIAINSSALEMRTEELIRRVETERDRAEVSAAEARDISRKHSEMIRGFQQKVINK